MRQIDRIRRARPVVNPGIPKKRRYHYRKTSDRDEKKWSAWRLKVFKRDGFRCQKCGSNKHLEPHHIKPFYYFIDLQYDVNNGQTLCHREHKEIEERRKRLGIIGNCHKFNKVIKKKGRYYRFNWRADKWIETIRPESTEEIIRNPRGPGIHIIESPTNKIIG